MWIWADHRSAECSEVFNIYLFPCPLYWLMHSYNKLTMTELEEIKVCCNKSLLWVWRAVILLGNYILPQHVYILSCKRFIHYFLCILHANENLNYVKAKDWVQCWQEWVLHCKYNILYLIDTCIFTTTFILWKHNVQSNSIYFKDVLSNGFDFPVSLKKICACQEKNALTRFFICVILAWMYCNLRKLLQVISIHCCKLKLFRCHEKKKQPPSSQCYYETQMSWNVIHLCVYSKDIQYECTLSSC